MGEVVEFKNMKNIAEDAFEAIKSIETVRADVMEELKGAAEAGATDQVISLSIDGGAAIEVDIATGAGALVLDNYLQELSTVEQAAAQLVAQANKAQKQVHSQTGQM